MRSRNSQKRVALLVGALMGASLVALAPVGCGTARSNGGSAAVPVSPLTTAQIAALIPARVADGREWSDAILTALVENKLAVDQPSVCAVIAVVGQESGFQADPVVPGLARLVRARIDRYKSKLGPVGDPLFERLLAGHAPNDARSFEQRLNTVHSERDVDVLFRDLLTFYQANHPAMFQALRWAGQLVDLDELNDLNPITTAGPMQVSVRFAEQWALTHPQHPATFATIRDTLYTRAGGVYYGTARLLAYAVRYDQPLFRFADYNAGFYSSRNAALQAQLSRLTSLPLALDGDLLAYQKNGQPREEASASLVAAQTFAERFAPQLSARDLRRELLLEKTLAFEDTDTYRAIKAAAERHGGRASEYAMLPSVTLNSPKLSRPLSTAWFARSVDRRYQTCLAAKVGNGDWRQAPTSR